MSETTSMKLAAMEFRILALLAAITILISCTQSTPVPKNTESPPVSSMDIPQSEKVLIAATTTPEPSETTRDAMPTSTPTHALTPTPTQSIYHISPPPTKAIRLSLDDRYAVITHAKDTETQTWILDTLGAQWFFDWTSNVENIPEGRNKVIALLSLPAPDDNRIREIARQAPGSVWYVLGEPNRRHDYEPHTVVRQLHDLYATIRMADPTAKITSPSVLNWDFTCVGCSGYMKGSVWMEKFRSTYLSIYNEEPPIDYWAIDVYPIDWHNLPTVDHQIAIDQIEGMSSYLSSIPGQSDKPIWITELGLHWGWDSIVWPFDERYDQDCQGWPQPAGTYHTDKIVEYLSSIFDWLDANATSKNIERWFVLSTYTDIAACNQSAYAGLTLFDSPNIGADLTPVGEFFRSKVLGMSPDEYIE